uniref:Uncharacterized protein n=1 Tax=Hemiselmis andersenii TaxID=464988 RepID=A0A6U4PWP6_HEMAN|mmetsp:Transcript_22552/g.54947  ORF Transcript_22552/g.54947 Transcript_22552/m.54947 type:complete len:120 (+) Transcript_22552:247-606(+)
MPSPAQKKRKMKVYEVECKHPVSDEAIEKLNAGVRLKDARDQLIKAHGARRLSEKRIEMAVGEGKYHQVKRMVAAVSNRVESLHRSRVCGLSLPDDLKEGEWRHLSPEEVKELLLDADE